MPNHYKMSFTPSAALHRGAGSSVALVDVMAKGSLNAPEQRATPRWKALAAVLYSWERHGREYWQAQCRNRGMQG